MCVLSLVAGCYHPDIPDGSLHCGTADQCPSGFACGNGLCYRPSTLASLDFSVADLTMGNPPFGTGVLGVVDLSGKHGTLVVNTETGAIFLTDSSVDGGVAMTIVPAGSGAFSTVQMSGGPNIAIWNFESLTLPAGIDIQPSLDSASVLVFAATMNMTIESTLSWVGFGGIGGGPHKPGGTRGSTATAAAAGGTDGSGGGGGGYAANGANGGGAAGGMGGAMYGTADIDPVYFGTGGAGGGGAAGTASSPGNGGNGGGAAVLLASHLVVGGTIDVSGLAGSSAASSATGPSGGGGGGSGGSLLISANSVSFESGAVLHANGGAGGMGVDGGKAGGAGSDGRILVAADSLVGSPNALPSANFVTMPLAAFPR